VLAKKSKGKNTGDDMFLSVLRGGKNTIKEGGSVLYKKELPVGGGCVEKKRGFGLWIEYRHRVKTHPSKK